MIAGIKYGQAHLLGGDGRECVHAMAQVVARHARQIAPLIPVERLQHIVGDQRARDFRRQIEQRRVGHVVIKRQAGRVDRLLFRRGEHDPLRKCAPRRAKVEVERGGRKQGTTPEDNPGTRLPNR